MEQGIGDSCIMRSFIISVLSIPQIQSSLNFSLNAISIFFRRFRMFEETQYF
jgi:hypothetical protein